MDSGWRAWCSNGGIGGSGPGHDSRGHKALQAEHEPAGQSGDGRRTQANRDRRQTKKRRLQADREELARHRSSSTNQEKSGPSPKGKGKRKSKDQSGKERCFSCPLGRGTCSDVPPGGECRGAVKRVSGQVQIVPVTVPQGVRL